MYRVAILEDQKVYARVYEDYLKELLDMEELNYEVDIYESIKELESNMDNHYQLFVLDYSSEGVNGVDFVKKVKSSGNNADIVFVAENEEAKKSYESMDAYVIMKPVKEVEIKEIFRKCVLEFFSRESITITKDDVEIEIHPEDIYFVEHIYNAIRVYGENYAICTLDSLEDLFPILAGKKFFQCHKDYIVNLEYVQEIEKYDFSMLNGQVVPIAKNMYKAAQKELLEYIK